MSISDIPDNKTFLLRPAVTYTAALPILEKKDEILDAIRTHQVVIVAGETGSGKTTQLPLICLEAGRGTAGKIGCTQPRRIAAISIANRVAAETGSTLGREVGYKIRFSDRETPQTCLKFMTDGILLAEIERDPSLSRYDTLIIDEAHERSLNIDFILGYLRNLIRRRADLKIIISSATIDTQLFSTSFGNAPVIRVSGRMYPVEVLYLSENRDDTGDETYIDEAVRAASDLLDLHPAGDMLIFMPTERDIRETCNRLRRLERRGCLVLPLFSRLGRVEQEKIFRESSQRKIVVATNIAETSITVPGIRFVVDTGLARIPRYAPRLRTNRLAVERISRAAADQRMGRCGRVMDGVCIRLYSQKEYLAADPYTLPEIKRSNLAGVILSMIAHRLGDIADFPFLEPPSRTAIAEGYAALRELGALDRENRLTRTGKEMSLMPLDPNIGRMVIAAREENALREVQIIAAALSIVDPRERPFEKRDEADAMHRRFCVPGSDFLSYVRLWDSFEHEWKTLGTQNKMRKFCHEHFLSYTRMTEWHDVHGQICDTLHSMRNFRENSSPASPEAVHRSLLPGLLANCACKTEDGTYRAARGRELVIFPGSALGKEKPDWIICHEVVETSRVFARTVCPIDPAWIEKLGAHLCSHTWSEPWFDAQTGVVRATERISLFGMQIAEHASKSYGKIDPEKSAEVFIREGLVEENLESDARFYVHNKNLRREIDKLEAKLRTRSLFAGEAAMEQFYAERLKRISSVHDLKRLIMEKGGDEFLFMTPKDLLSAQLPDTAADLPDFVTIGDCTFALQYEFDPGGERDGVTLRVPCRDAALITENSLGYIVPAMWPAKIEEMLRRLPKETRKRLMPLAERSQELSKAITVCAKPFEESLSEAIKKLLHIEVDPSLLRETALPDHLSMRIEVVDQNGTALRSGRGHEVLSDLPQSTHKAARQYREAFAKHEKSGLTQWDFGTLPEHLEVVPSNGGVPLYGYFALDNVDGRVDLRLFGSKPEAQKAHRAGVIRLVETVLSTEFAWIERDLRITRELKLLCAAAGGAEALRDALLASVRNFLLDVPQCGVRTQEEFSALAQKVQMEAKNIGHEAVTLLDCALRLYRDNSVKMAKVKEARHANLKKELACDLDRYIHDILRPVPFTLLRQYPRYLRAFGVRIERAFLEPLKYGRNRALLQTRLEKLSSWMRQTPCGELRQSIDEYNMMTEEYAISLFAQQEVKTAFRISAERLNKREQEIDRAMATLQRTFSAH